MYDNLLHDSQKYEAKYATWVELEFRFDQWESRIDTKRPIKCVQIDSGIIPALSPWYVTFEITQQIANWFAGDQIIWHCIKI